MSYRINKYDNLKGFSILLIVLGHILLLSNFSNALFIHRFISIIDLPIFFFVAGYFSKIGPVEPIKSFKRLFIPYILFSLIYAGCMLVIGSNIPPLFVYTSFALWFLLSLFFMKIFLPIFDKFKYPILTSFIIALIIGFINIDPNLLGLTRFFTYFPVFLVGFYYDDIKNKLEKDNKQLVEIFENKSIIFLTGIIILICLILVTIFIPTKVVVLATSYDKPTEIVLRTIVLILGIGTILYLNRIFSNKKLIITQMGVNSYAVYLIHIFIVSLLNSYLLKKLIPNNELLFIIFAIITTILIVFILSRNFVSNILNKIINYICNILLENN